MKRFPDLAIKLVVRLVISTVFTAAWFFINEGELSPSMPLAFCGMVCLAGAWFTYLRSDGFAILSKPLTSFKRLFTKNAEDRIERAMGAAPRNEEKEAAAHENTPLTGILAGVISGGALVILSFLFH